MWTLYTNHIIGKGELPQPEDIIDRCGSFSWADDSDTLAVSLTFDSTLDLAEGRSHLTLKKDSKVVFQGVIVNKTNKDKTSSYTAMDYAFYLNKNEDIIQFNGLNAKDAIYALLNRQGIGGACTALSTKISKFYKGKAVSDIIKDILEQCKLELGEDVCMEMRGNVLWIDRISNLKLDCKYALGTDFSVTRSMEDMVNYVDVASNEESDTGSYAHANDDNSIKIFGRLSKVVTIEKGNAAQAQNVANKYLYAYNGTKRELTCTLVDIENCEDIRAKRSIYISIARYGLQGYYKIKSAQHSLNNGIHKVTVVIDFSGVTFADPEELTAASSSTNNSDNSSSVSSKNDQIIAFAKQFLGVPYVNGGGNPPNSFDCSSYVAYVFNHFGYNLTDYTYDMINQGTRISIQEATEGDILFFHNTGHVGIYIGNDQFIHCPHTGDVVKISQFSTYGDCNAAIRVL